MNLTFLGSSDSAGIPVHNCDCSVCNEYRKNKQENLSTCAYLEIEDEVILLDAGIDSISSVFDERKIQAVFLTHFHADHCLGLLRLRHSYDKIQCYHPKDLLGFSDLFKHKHSINYQTLKAFEELVIKGISFTAIPLIHSKNTFGYFIKYKNKTIAYLTDCSGLPNESMDFLKKQDIDYIFIDACYDETVTEGNHLNYLQATTIINKLNAKNAYFLHTSHKTQEYINTNKIKLQYQYVNRNESFSI